jgi:hypothetical protein
MLSESFRFKALANRDKIEQEKRWRNPNWTDWLEWVTYNHERSSSVSVLVAFVLQAASKLEGSFSDLAAAVSPYLESTTTNVQRYYRLRSVPFRLSGTNLHGAGFSLGGAGVPGCNFVIEASTNLLLWQPLQTNPSPFALTDPNATNYSQRFYRAVLAH